jgi:predicted transcriptional regulator of viral defense system
MTTAESTNEGPPDWDALFEVAQGQQGYFTTAQAASVGYSPQLLYKYLRNGTVTRVRRGVYRLVHFPADQEEDLVPLWLWSERVGVFSHETALALQDLSDALPSRVHMTVPAAWRHRRLKVPEGLVLHYADLDESELRRAAVVPFTTPKRTIADCMAAHFAPDLVHQAVVQARQRGLISRDEEAELLAALPGGADGS